MTKMGEFRLVMVQERATKQTVDADTICYKGEVREELKNAVRQEGVSLVALGRPTGALSVFELAELQAFAAEIKAEREWKSSSFDVSGDTAHSNPEPGLPAMVRVLAIDDGEQDLAQTRERSPISIECCYVTISR